MGSSPTTSRQGGGDGRIIGCDTLEDEDKQQQLRRQQQRRRQRQTMMPRLPPLSIMSNGAEKNAALLLMNLSMSDADREAIRSREKEDEAMSAVSASVSEAVDTHRSKRRRATSM